MASAFTPSVVSTATMPTSMTDAEATRLGLKVYVHGGSYVSGLAPTVTLSSGGGTLSSVLRAVFAPYQMQDGTWRLRFNVGVSVSSVARTSATLSVVGVVFRTVSEGQAIAAWSGNQPTTTQGFVASAGATMHIAHTSATCSVYHYSGDVELDLKPTWAY